jgi:hypothetical protein
MTDASQPPQIEHLETRISAGIRTISKALPFKQPIMDENESSKLAIDMNDLLLLAWTLLARRNSDGDDIHFAWGYGKASSKTLSHRKVAVEKSNMVSDVLQQIQILRKQALIPEETLSEDQDGNYMIINNSFGVQKSGSLLSTVFVAWEEEVC